MATSKQMTVRVNPVLDKLIKLLVDKLQIKQAEVIRLAVTRLAEQEGVLRTGKK